MDNHGPGPPAVVHCASCHAAVDVSMGRMCPFCGTALEPQEPPPAAEEEAPAEGKAVPTGPGLGTRVAVLVVGLGMLGALALLQRFAQDERPVATSVREPETAPAPPRVAPLLVTPAPTVAAPPASTRPRSCCARNVDRTDHHPPEGPRGPAGPRGPRAPVEPGHARPPGH